MNAIASTDIQIRGSPPSGTIPVELPRLRPPVPAAAAHPEAKSDFPNEPSGGAVEKAAQAVNAFLASGESHVQFAVHRATNRMMVEVIDDRTGDVVRTIPSKELLDLAAKIGEMVGLLLDKKG